MIMRQFLHFEPIAASYLFGCAGHAAAAVVDPVGEIAPYLQVAEDKPRPLESALACRAGGLVSFVHS
jgi:hypothetical protein